MFYQQFARHDHGDDAADRRARFFRHAFGHHRFRGRHGGMRRRGDTKFEMLAILAEGPRHGYDLMLEMERRSGHKPSPGSIYPTLQALEEGGFLRGEERDGKRVYEITESGRQLLAERPAGEDEDDMAMGASFVRAAMAQRTLMGASREVFRSGNPELVEKLADLLETARKEIYTLLAEAR